MQIEKHWKCLVSSGAVMDSGLHRKEDGGIWKSIHTENRIRFSHVSGKKPVCEKFTIKIGTFNIKKVPWYSRNDFYFEDITASLDDFKIFDGLYCFYPNYLGSPYYLEEIKNI